MILPVAAVGRERLVLDLSCRRREREGRFFVVTDRWTRFTTLALTNDTIAELSQHCAEFLVHGVDVEGKRCGIEEDLVRKPTLSEDELMTVSRYACSGSAAGFRYATRAA